MRKEFRRWLLDGFVEPLVSQGKLKAYATMWVRLVLWFKRPFIITVTGSVGKTTTKDLVFAALSHPDAQSVVGFVNCTKDNLNVDVDLLGTLLLRQDGSFIIPWNYFGRVWFLVRVPIMAGRAILGKYPKVWVLECGVCSMSDLEWQARLLSPDVAVVTRIGAAHLEKFKTMQGLVYEKGALVRAVNSAGLVVLGLDHDYVGDLEGMSRARVVKVPGAGLELAKNIAREICNHVGVQGEIVDLVMKDFKRPKGRQNLIEAGGVRIIDDSFNANPLSMKFGLDMLSEIAGDESRRVAVLGSMAELGEEAPGYHEDVGKYARERADVVIGVGELARLYAPDYWFNDSEACAYEVRKLVRPGDCVLVKGSGATKVGKVVLELKR